MELAIKILTFVIDLLTIGNTYWYRKHRHIDRHIAEVKNNDTK